MDEKEEMKSILESTFVIDKKIASMEEKLNQLDRELEEFLKREG